MLQLRGRLSAKPVVLAGIVNALAVDIVGGLAARLSTKIIEALERGL